MCTATTAHVPRFQYSAQMCITPMQAYLGAWCRLGLMHTALWLLTEPWFESKMQCAANPSSPFAAASSADFESWCRSQLTKHCFIWLDTQALWPMWTGTKCSAHLCRTATQAQVGDTCCGGCWLRHSAHTTSSAVDEICCAAQLIDHCFIWWYNI